MRTRSVLQNGAGVKFGEAPGGGEGGRRRCRSQKLAKKTPKRVLALPDLEQAKTAVLNSLTSASGKRTYDHAIREFVSMVLLGTGARV